jgi:hypothetical protein
VEAQLAKYHELLRQNCGTELAVLNYMMAYVNSSHYIRKEVYSNKPKDLPEGSMVRQNAKLWYKVAKMHIRDLEDMENNVAALRNSLPVVIGTHTGKIPVQAEFTSPSGSNVFNVDAFNYTHDHLLTLTARGTHYSHLLRENSTSPGSHFVAEAQSYYNVSNVSALKGTMTRTTASPSIL